MVVGCRLITPLPPLLALLHACNDAAAAAAAANGAPAAAAVRLLGFVAVAFVGRCAGVMNAAGCRQTPPHTPHTTSSQQPRGAYAAAAALPRRSIARCSAITRNAQSLRPRRRSARRAGVVVRTHKMRPAAAAMHLVSRKHCKAPTRLFFARANARTGAAAVTHAGCWWWRPRPCAHRRQSDRESGAALLFSTYLTWVVTMKRAAVGFAWPRRTPASCGASAAARAGCTRRA